MPFYDYTCVECEKQISLFRLIAERDDPTYCECGKGSILTRTLSCIAPKATNKGTAKTRVNDFIKNAKTDLKDDKKSLSERVK